MMNVSVETVLAVVVNTALIGAAWGNLNAGQASQKVDMEIIKGLLGLSKEGVSVFIPRAEAKLLLESAHAALARVQEEVDDLRLELIKLKEKP